MFEPGNGDYVVHPAPSLNPAVPAAFLVGPPFLFPRLKHSLAARLLAGMLVAPAAACFVPPAGTLDTGWREPGASTSPAAPLRRTP